MTVQAQGRQDEHDELVRAQQQTAIILERLSARLDAVEKWQGGEERRQEREWERRDERIEKAPDQQRANLALLLSGLSGVIYLLTFVSQHWH